MIGGAALRCQSEADWKRLIATTFPMAVGVKTVQATARASPTKKTRWQMDIDV
jgi:hypothetical protein